MALVYAVVAVLTIPVSIHYDVGATAAGGPTDMPLRGTAFSPPLFVPVLLLAGAALALRRHRALAIAGAALDTLVALAILGYSILNVGNGLEATQAVGAPSSLTYLVALVSALLAVGIAVQALATIVSAARGHVSRDRRGER